MRLQAPTTVARCVARAVTAFRTQKHWRCAPLRHSNLSNAAADQLDDQVPKFIDFDSPPIVFRKSWITSSKSRQRRESKKTAAGESQNLIS
jgi:hypothetical protein